MWSDYMWETYKQAGGEETIEMFHDNLSKRLEDNYPKQIQKLQEAYVADKNVRENTYEQISDLVDFVKDIKKEPSEEIEDSVEAHNLFEDGLSEIDACFAEWCAWEWNEIITDGTRSEINYKEFLGFFSNENLAYYTTMMSLMYSPDLFVPYYFSMTYNVLENIGNTFGIELPPVPAKADYKGRVWHYANICKSLYAYRIEKGLTFGELFAFLYDFAPKFIGGIDSYIIKDIPAPKSAYFIGGSASNGDAVAENDSENIARWQCSPDTRAGDMIVMYLRTPVSAITSVWRARSIGFIDPFFWYYRMTYIGNPIKIKNIPLAQIKADEILGKTKIVKKNMQGINGVELLPSEYNHIIDIAGKDVCRLEYVMSTEAENYPNEKAVEEKLIKPLLVKLGYSEKDYVQQMYIAIGNHNHTLIPDFVLKPKKSNGHQSGYVVVEAKRSIKSRKQLDDAKMQVRGYAKLLGAKYSVVASMEKIYVMKAEDDYTAEILVETWNGLSNQDTMYRMMTLLGNDDK